MRWRLRDTAFLAVLWTLAPMDANASGNSQAKHCRSIPKSDWDYCRPCASVNAWAVLHLQTLGHMHCVTWQSAHWSFFLWLSFQLLYTPNSAAKGAIIWLELKGNNSWWTYLWMLGSLLRHHSLSLAKCAHGAEPGNSTSYTTPVCGSC